MSAQQRRFTDLFVERPVLSIVISLVLLLLGAIAFGRLAVRETPELQPPTVTVTTVWPGADPGLVETDVTEVLEREVNGIQGIRTLTSTSREQVSSITVEFVLERDLEEAANDVRARVARARANLPPDVEEPVVEKADADASPVLFLRVSSDVHDLKQLSETASTLIRERLETVSGVSAVDIYGEQKYAIRVELDPVAMAARGLALRDVEDAIRAGNADVPAGRVEGEAIELTMRLDAGLDTPEAFEALVVSRQGESLVRLSDVGRVRMGAENERTAARSEGVPSISVAVMPQAQANILDISDEVKRRLPELASDLPEGMSIDLTYDRTEAVRSSISEVEETLFVAFALVAAVIFLFLRDLRSTLVPVVAIPVSIVGTFLFLWLLGYSINIFTLFGLVLAIGLVVDDAIVVLENAYRGIEAGKDPRTAAIEGTREIVFPVLATTLSLVVVFLPVVFTGGPSGRLFTEFGATVVVSVALSGVVALTLTPMLCAVLLRPISQAGVFHRATEPFFQGTERAFGATVRFFTRFLVFPFGALAVALIVGAIGLWWLPREFFPLEDRNLFMLRTTAPEGTSFPFMDARMAELEPELMDAVPERKVLMSRVAAGPRGVAAATNTGMFIVPLVAKEERAHGQQAIVARVSKLLADVTAFQVIPSQQPTVGRGSSSPLQFVLRHQDFDALAAELPGFLAEVRKIPGLSGVFEDLKLNRPEIGVSIDRDKAAALGVSARDLARSLQILSASLELSQFERNGRRYPVMVGLVPEARATPDDLLRLQIRTADGGTVPIGNLVRFEERSSASARYRFDRTPSATISANLDGITLGEAIARVRALADEKLPKEFRTSLAGESRDFEDSNQQLALVFGLAVVLVWLTLAAQFDSFLDPIAILVSVPLALSGALFGLVVMGMTLSFFAQVGLVLLVGLVTKNGILLVEMANVLRLEQGLGRWEAAVEAARIRFRPVVMTSIATVVGAVPIALGFTSSSRAPLGVAVVSGMVVATALTLYVTPVVHAAIGAAVDRVRGRKGTATGAATAAVVVLLVLPGDARAAVTSLAELLGVAADQSVALEAEAHRVDAVDATSDRVRSGVLPTVSATGSVVVGRDPRYLALGTTGPVTAGSVRAVMPLVDAPTWAGLRAAHLRREVAELGLEAAEEQALAATALAWVEVVRAQQGVVEAEALLARSHRLADLARDRVELGAAAPIEATRAELLEAQDEQRLIAARVDADAARLALLEVVGLPLEGGIEVAAEDLPLPGGSDQEHPEIVAARLADDISRADRASALAGVVPQLDLVGSAGVLLPAGADAIPTITVGVEASVPLFTGTARVSDARRAAAERDAALADAEDLERRRAVDVAIADQRVDAGRQAWEVARRARALAEREVALAEDRFATGAASNVEVVDAQGRLATAIGAEVEARAAHDRAVLLAWSSRGRLRDLAR